MWGVVPIFQFRFLVAASQKNPILALRRWKKHFVWDETKIGLRVFLAIPRATRVSDMATL
jgi:hypothetical protein